MSSKFLQFPKELNTTALNELFGKKKAAPLSPEDHLQKLSKEAHNASHDATNQSTDTWAKAPNPSYIRKSQKDQVLAKHEALYGKRSGQTDPEDARGEHRGAKESHEVVAAMHANVAHEAFKQGAHDLAQEHLKMAEHHGHEAHKHENEMHRIQNEYPW